MRLFAFILAFAVLFSLFTFAQQNDCDYRIDVLLDSFEFTKDNFTWRMKAVKIEGISTNITGTAKIEVNDNIVKSYRPWTNLSISKQKTSNEYSPNLNEGEYKITAEIFVECSDLDKSNNIDIKTFKIVNENTNEMQNLNENTELQIEIQQQITEEQIIETNQTNGTINDGQISTNDEKTTNIGNQQNQKTQNTITTAANENFNNVVNLKEDLEENEEPVLAYESSNEKAKQLIIYSILGLSVLINIVLIWKR